MEKQPLISVVIPARDEERSLPACLAAIARASDRVESEVEVVLVANRCTDRTEEIAHNAGARVIRDESKNLALIRNAGVAEARGELVVTIDADSVMSDNLLELAARALSDENTVGGGVMIYPDRVSLGILVTGLYLLPVVLWYRISGGAFFFRKADFEAMGGFNPELLSAEDIDFAKRLRDLGRPRGQRFVTLFRAYIRTSMRKFDSLGDWYFVLRPWEVWRLFGGKDKRLADKIWYDFKR